MRQPHEYQTYLVNAGDRLSLGRVNGWKGMIMQFELIKESRDSCKDGWTENMCETRHLLLFQWLYFTPASGCRVHGGFWTTLQHYLHPSCEIAVPPASLHLDYHHPISCIQLSTVNEESSQTLGPLSSCCYLLRQGAPRVSQAGNITAALKNESYFDSHNVCNATQEPLSDFSSIVV